MSLGTKTLAASCNPQLSVLTATSQNTSWLLLGHLSSRGSSLSSNFMLSNILCLDSDASIWSALCLFLLPPSLSSSIPFPLICSVNVEKREQGRFSGGLCFLLLRAFSHLSSYGLSPSFLASLHLRVILPHMVFHLLHFIPCWLLELEQRLAHSSFQ